MVHNLELKISLQIIVIIIITHHLFLNVKEPIWSRELTILHKYNNSIREWFRIKTFNINSNNIKGQSISRPIKEFSIITIMLIIT
jgi:hypothetical protein